MRAQRPILRAIAQHLRLEEVGLAAATIVGPVVLGGRPASLAAAQDPLAGILELVGLSGLLACLVVRRTDPTFRVLFTDPGSSVRQDGGATMLTVKGAFALSLRLLALVAAFLLEAALCAGHLALAGSAALVPFAVPLAAAVVARLRLPPASRNARRALVAPFLLVASAELSALVAAVVSPTNAGSTGGSFDASTLPALAIALAPVYFIFVYTPRQVAEREGSVASWAVRYLVFVVGVVVGAVLWGASP